MSIDDFDSFEIFSEDYHDDDTTFNLTPNDHYNLTPNDHYNLTPNDHYNLKKRVLSDDEEKKRRLRNRLSTQVTRDKQREYIEFLKYLIDEKNALIQFQRKKIFELRKELIQQEQEQNKNI